VFDGKRSRVVLDGEMRSCDGRDKDFVSAALTRLQGWRSFSS
jgi:hypothetical protein